MNVGLFFFPVSNEINLFQRLLVGAQIENAQMRRGYRKFVATEVAQPESLFLPFCDVRVLIGL
jgi:hypothetical protein